MKYKHQLYFLSITRSGLTRFWFWAGCMLAIVVARSQNPAMPVDSADHRLPLIVDLQVYPAGKIVGIGTEILLRPHAYLSLRYGFNFIDRQDFSRFHDHEEGWGIGASAGWHRHFYFKKGNWLAGFNTDVWNEWIDWTNEGQPDAISGRTYTLVLQPWLETGYFLGKQEKAFQFGLTAGFGREINIITSGETVAQGWIGSLALHIHFNPKACHCPK